MLVALIGFVAWGGVNAANASTDDCASAVAGFQSSEQRIVRQAGSPVYVCVANDGDARQARFDKATNTVTVEEQPSATNYVVLLAHETGHAWGEKHHVSYLRFGEMRGFVRPSLDKVPAWTQTVIEDYADTFAYALGDWRPLEGVRVPAPYQFQHEAGVPTAEQIVLLRALQLLSSCWLPC